LFIGIPPVYWKNVFHFDIAYYPWRINCIYWLWTLHIQHRVSVVVNSGIILVRGLIVISVVLFKIDANDLLFRLALRQGRCLMQCIDCLRVRDLNITVSFYNYICEHVAYVWKRVSSISPCNILYVFIIFFFYGAVSNAVCISHQVGLNHKMINEWLIGKVCLCPDWVAFFEFSWRNEGRSESRQLQQHLSCQRLFPCNMKQKYYPFKGGVEIFLFLLPYQFKITVY
jgi:hypothetical protein